jgi:hypothetical protein
MSQKYISGSRGHLQQHPLSSQRRLLRHRFEELDGRKIQVQFEDSDCSKSAAIYVLILV